MVKKKMTMMTTGSTQK